MRQFIGLLVLLFAVVSPALGDPASNVSDVELVGANGMRANVSRTGLNIRVSRDVPTRNGTKSTGQVEISISQIQEVDANQEPLKSHVKMSSFANVDFNVSKVTNISIANAPGVFADCLNCAGTLRETGTVISLGVCAIKTNGTLTMSDEMTNITAGQLKITFTMSSWGTWLNDGNKLAVDINIKAPQNREIVNNTDGHRKPTKFSLGGDAFMEFSRLAYQDNRWYSMPAGYPMFISKGSKGANNKFRLIFDHFNTSTVYDPSVEVGYQVDDSGSTDTNATSTAPIDSTNTIAVTTAAITPTAKNAASTAAVSVLPLLAAAFLQILVRV